MRHRREPDERLAATVRQLHKRTLLREAVHASGTPRVTSVYGDWTRAGRAVDLHRTIAGPRGCVANRADSDETG